MTQRSSLWSELRKQGRATVAAFTVVGISTLYTMEAWWLSWQLRMPHLLAYTIVGIGVVLLLARIIGFRGDSQSGQDGGGGEDGQGGESGNGGGQNGERGGDDGDRRLGTTLYQTFVDATQAIAQGFVAAYLVFFLFGVLTTEDSLGTAARMGVFHVVPLGFGAALANDLFAGSEDEQPPRQFVETLGVFSLGAIFLSAPIALTQEMDLIASYASWGRLAALVVVTLLVTHLTLFELEAQGQAQRASHRSKPMQVGHAFTVYTVGVLVSIGLLAAFGHFGGQPVSVWVQKIVVLSFPTSIGASAAQVIV